MLHAKKKVDAIRRVRKPLDGLKLLAKFYGIKLKKEVISVWGISDVDGISLGVGALACNPVERTVYLAPPFRYCELLHELVHVIVYVPTPRVWERGIEICESRVLLPFERCLANAITPASYMGEVLKLQEMTSLNKDGSGPMVADLNDGDYENSPRWQTGLDRCRRLGLIDGSGYPTFRYPDWSVLSRKERESLFR